MVSAEVAPPQSSGPAEGEAGDRWWRTKEQLERRKRSQRRLAILPRLGLEIGTRDIMRAYLDQAIPAAGGAVALDAGCGKKSHLSHFRDRIAELVGVDVHPPAQPLPWTDRFQVADVCRDIHAFEPATFDVILSSFTVEHFPDPPAAFRTLNEWLRPGGTLILTTVNRRHPFVNAYLSMPRWLGRPLQRFIKLSEGDAHPLVGVCNSPAQIRRALADAGFVDVDLVTRPHLAKAWGNRLLGFLLGLSGDLLTRGIPSRRSTIVARGRKATS